MPLSPDESDSATAGTRLLPEFGEAGQARAEGRAGADRRRRRTRIAGGAVSGGRRRRHDRARRFRPRRRDQSPAADSLRHADVGRPKLEVAAARLRDAQSRTSRSTLHRRAVRRGQRPSRSSAPTTSSSMARTTSATRYLVNDACVMARPAERVRQRVPVRGPGVGVRRARRSVLPLSASRAAAGGLIPNCAEAGVLGVLPGVIGTIQATEAIKLLTGIGEPLVGRLLLYDALRMRFRRSRCRAIRRVRSAATRRRFASWWPTIDTAALRRLQATRRRCDDSRTNSDNWRTRRPAAPPHRRARAVRTRAEPHRWRAADPASAAADAAQRRSRKASPSSSTASPAAAARSRSRCCSSRASTPAISSGGIKAWERFAGPAVSEISRRLNSDQVTCSILASELSTDGLSSRPASPLKWTGSVGYLRSEQALHAETVEEGGLRAAGHAASGGARRPRRRVGARAGRGVRHPAGAAGQGAAEAGAGAAARRRTRAFAAATDWRGRRARSRSPT